MTSVKYNINLKTFLSGATATTINIPLSMSYQLVDNSELVERKFIDVETKKAINPILDYDKVRFIPVNNVGTHVRKINYIVNLLNGPTLEIPSSLQTLTLTNDDIKFQRNVFKSTSLYLKFYDSDNSLIQNFVSDLSMYLVLTSEDIQPLTAPNAGQPKPVNSIPIKFYLSNPLTVHNGFSEGYHLYDSKNGQTAEHPKELFMRGSLLNAKTGKQINLMTEATPYTIDILTKKLYTKYILKRNNTGYFYEVDSDYSSNVNYSTGLNGIDLEITLYQIQSL